MCAVHLNLHSFPTRRSSDLIPRMVRRVVWGLDEVMAIFWPTSAFVSVDLPALGRPIKQMKPARCSADGSGFPDGSGVTRAPWRWVDCFGRCQLWTPYLWWVRLPRSCGTLKPVWPDRLRTSLNSST